MAISTFNRIARGLISAPLLFLTGAADPLLETPAETGATMVAVPLVQPFDIDRSRRMAVPVTIAGQGPYFFVIDTGAERTVISRELAARLALTEGQALRLATISGPTTAPSFRVASLAMADLALAPFEAPALYGSNLGAAGLLGVDMLQNRRVLIDFRKQQMQISESRRKIRPIIRDDDAIVVTARNQAGRLILSDARVDGRRIDIIVDTGAQTSIGNLALKKLIVARRLNATGFFPTQLTGVNGETITADRSAIRHINIEGVEVNDLPVSFTDSHAFRALGLDSRPALLLGMDSLQLFDRIEIDFANKRIIFDLPDGAARASDIRLTTADHRPRG